MRVINFLKSLFQPTASTDTKFEDANLMSKDLKTLDKIRKPNRDQERMNVHHHSEGLEETTHKLTVESVCDYLTALTRHYHLESMGRFVEDVEKIIKLFRSEESFKISKTSKSQEQSHIDGSERWITSRARNLKSEEQKLHIGIKDEIYKTQFSKQPRHLLQSRIGKIAYLSQHIQYQKFSGIQDEILEEWSKNPLFTNFLSLWISHLCLKVKTSPSASLPFDVLAFEISKQKQLLAHFLYFVFKEWFSLYDQAKQDAVSLLHIESAPLLISQNPTWEQFLHLLYFVEPFHPEQLSPDPQQPESATNPLLLSKSHPHQRPEISKITIISKSSTSNPYFPQKEIFHPSHFFSAAPNLCHNTVVTTWNSPMNSVFSHESNPTRFAEKGKAKEIEGAKECESIEKATIYYKREYNLCQFSSESELMQFPLTIEKFKKFSKTYCIHKQLLLLKQIRLALQTDTSSKAVSTDDVIDFLIHAFIKLDSVATLNASPNYRLQQEFNCGQVFRLHLFNLQRNLRMLHLLLGNGFDCVLNKYGVMAYYVSIASALQLMGAPSLLKS